MGRHSRPENGLTPDTGDETGGFLKGYSIEVLPRTAAAIADFRPLLPERTRVYIAHIEGTPLKDMVDSARRLSGEGFAVMPHIPARLVPDQRALSDLVARYWGEAGVAEALLLAGGRGSPLGPFGSSMDLVETGLFGDFRRLHFAGHPEGNRDIDPDSSGCNLNAALRWKQRFSETTSAQVALVTQFCFDPAPVIAWTEFLADQGIDLPIHLGVAGPTKLQNLLRYAVACGVGPSMKVLQKRATDIRRLLLPYEPDGLLSAVARHRAANPGSRIEQVHVFPLGGIRASTDWFNARLPHPTFPQVPEGVRQ